MLKFRLDKSDKKMYFRQENLNLNGILKLNLGIWIHCDYKWKCRTVIVAFSTEIRER